MYLEKLKEEFEKISSIASKVCNLKFDLNDMLYEAKNWNDSNNVADMHWVNGAWCLYQDIYKDGSPISIAMKDAENLGTGFLALRFKESNKNYIFERLKPDSVTITKK